MLRRAWESLLARYESVVVGFAVTLCSLALVCSRPAIEREARVSVEPAVAQAVVAPRLQDLPTDPQYYRDRWIAETAAFYAAHPASPPPIARAVPAAGQRNAGVSVQAVSHLTGGSVQQAGHSQPIADRPDSRQAVTRAAVGGWMVAGCLLAGFLASACFHRLWPDRPSPLRDRPAAADCPALTRWDQSQGGTFALPIPQHWIAIRPTAGECCRRGIVGLSYLLAAAGGWSVLQL